MIFIDGSMKLTLLAKQSLYWNELQFTVVMERGLIELAKHLLQQFRDQLKIHFSCLFSWFFFLLHRVGVLYDLCRLHDPCDHLCHQRLSFVLYDHDPSPNLCDRGDDRGDRDRDPLNDCDDADCDPFRGYDLFHDYDLFRDFFLFSGPDLFAFVNNLRLWNENIFLGIFCNNSWYFFKSLIILSVWKLEQIKLIESNV